MWNHSHCHLSFSFKWNEHPVPLKTPKETGPKVTLFCGLIMEQVGGRHLSLLQQRSGCTPAVVNDMSQWIATQKCMWDFVSPLYPWEIQKGPVVPMTFLWRLLLSILSNCSVKLEWSGEMCVTQTLHLWQKTLYLFHPHILHSSSQKFAIILKRRFQTRLTQLWFSVGWDYFVLLFSPPFLLTWLTILGWCIKAGYEPHTHSHSPFTCLFFLSSSWILGPTCQFDVGISLFLCVNPTSFFAGLHFLL